MLATGDSVAELYPPVKIGPTWQQDEAGAWILPERTLGWQIAEWAAKWLNSDESDEDEGERIPWQFTLEQLRWLLWWYAVDEDGEFAYRTGVLQRMKGWGKDPLAAVVCLVELVGPSRFSHWDRDGNPVGKPHPTAWVQVAAVSRDQTRNTMTLFSSLMSKAFIAEYNIEPTIEIIRARGGKVRLEAVTSNYRTLEGGRSTFVLMNETHHWVRGNGGIQMFETVDGNVTKGNKRKGKSRYLAITNAYLPGEDSVAERMREAYEKSIEGRAADVRVMYDSLEAHEKTPLDPEILPDVIAMIRGDAVWLDTADILASILNTAISPARSRRMWLNQVVAEEDAVYEKADWTALRDPDLELAPDDEIFLGFDGGKTDDATALVAIRLSDRAIFPLLIEEKPDGPRGDGWEVDAQKFDSAVHEAFKSYAVLGFYADVALWESYITSWAEHYAEGLAIKSTNGRNAIAWDMRGSQQRSTRAHEELMRAILDKRLRHNGDPVLQRHVLAARRATNNWGLSFRKESPDSPKKVDGYAALMLAYTALTDYLSRGKKPKRRGGQGYFF